MTRGVSALSGERQARVCVDTEVTLADLERFGEIIVAF